MDFVVKLGETGIAFTYSNISPSEKVTVLQEEIKRDTKIEPKDQVLFTKKGYKLHSDETLSTLEKENNLQSTMTRIDPKVTRNFYTLYLFDQKRMSSESKSTSSSTPFFSETNEDLRNYLIDEKIVDKDFSSALQGELDSTNSENIKKINPNILGAEAKMFGHYLVIKKSFLQYVSRMKKLDRFIKEGESQLGSFDVLIKNSSLIYNPCKAKKNDVTKKFINQNEKNTGTIKKFEDSIDNLRKIELHDSLKTDKQKNLLDIYYDTDAMYKWRNSCVDFQANLKSKIEKISTIIKSLKKKIKEERDSSLNSTHPNFDKLKQTAESCTLEGVLAGFKKVYEEYKSIREAIEAYVYQSNSTNEEILKDEKWTKIVERDLDEDRKIFSEHIEKIEKVLDQLVKIKAQFEVQVGQCYRVLAKYNQELVHLEKEKLKQMSDDIEKMDKDFNYLLNPSLLPAAYQASLFEVNRRRDFAAIFDKTVKKLQTTLDSEIEQRKKFLSQYGRILPCQFIPQFKNMPPTLTITNPEVDIGLPKIEGLLPKEDTDNAQVEELERLNKELKLRIKKLEEENDTKSLKKKLDDLVRDYDAERDRNKALKAKVGELEKDRLAMSFRRAADSNHSSKDSDYDSMRADFDSLAKLALNAASSLDNQENMVPNLEHKNSRDGQQVQQLTQRVVCLNNILNQTVKTSFDIFFKKLNEKQKKYDESKNKFESLLQRGDEDLTKEKSKLTLHYEERLQELNEKYLDAQKRLEEYKKYQSEVAELKKKLDENAKNYQNHLEVAKNEVKNKLDLLKNKDEVIKSLTQCKESSAAQVVELKSSHEKEAQRIKLEHHEVLNNIHTLHKQEIEKLRSRIKSLENDISNKNIELDKLTHTQSLSDKDCKQKEDQIQKLSTQVETLNKKISKLNDDIAAYKNKFDNMELTIQNKTTDLTNANKQLSTITTERNQLQDDLSKYKQFNNETNKRLQSLSESLRKLESEKVTAKTEMEKLELDLEKKNIEINNLKEQISKITQERKEQLEELNKKSSESQQSEKNKISDLNAANSELNSQINTLKTQKEILSFDLDTKTKENENQQQKIKSLQAEIEKLSTVTENFNTEKEKVQSLENQINSLKNSNDKLQSEIDFKIKHTADLERNLKAAYEKYSTLEEKTQALEKENEGLKKDQESMKAQSLERVSLQNVKSGELQLKIAQLEEEINKKNFEIENLTTQIQRNNEDIDFLNETKSNLESSLKQKEETISNFEKQASQNQTLLKDLQNQEDSYMQDVKLKDKEIQDLNDEKNELTQSLERLKLELSEAQALITKERDGYEKQLSQKKLDAKSKIDYLKIERGSRNLFIPYAPGIYVPFSMHQYNEKEISNVLNGTSLEFEKTVYQNPEKSIRTSFYLDVDSLSSNYQEVLKNFSLLIVGTIKEIAPKMNKEIDDKKDSMMVKLENIDYMIGFEDEDMVMKNYV